MQDVTLLQEALPYFRRFKGTTFVVKIGGEAVRDRRTLDNFAEDVALLHSVGIRVVLVHGGGPQITELEKQLGIETRMVGGRRVTDEGSLRAVVMVLAGQMNVDICAAFRRQQIPAMGLCGVSAGIINARKRPPVKVSGGGDLPIDFGLVGDIVSINTAPIELLLDNGMVPVLSPLGSDEEGNYFNINADTSAARIAAALKAEKLLLTSAVPGVLTDPKDRTTLISQLTVAQAREVVRQGIADGGMIPKIEEAIRALEMGVRRAHILSATEPHQLLMETFTQAGCGTMLVP
ncbi:MAG: acetylglutamate kinase [Candidatus Sumerlaeia bacterium]|nr:acetylglutamate kinase [Candidatus Sumerlaeia bacterium]